MPGSETANAALDLTPTVEVLQRVAEVARRELGWGLIGLGDIWGEALRVWTSPDPRQYGAAVVFFDHAVDEVGTASSLAAAHHWGRTKTPPEPGEWIFSPSYEAAFHPEQPPRADPDDPRVLALVRARPDLYTLEKAVLLIGSYEHLGLADWKMDVRARGRERFIRAHGLRAWGDVTAALVDASRVQVNAESTAA